MSCECQFSSDVTKTACFCQQVLAKANATGMERMVIDNGDRMWYCCNPTLLVKCVARNQGGRREVDCGRVQLLLRRHLSLLGCILQGRHAQRLLWRHLGGGQGRGQEDGWSHGREGTCNLEEVSARIVFFVGRCVSSTFPKGKDPQLRI